MKAFRPLIGIGLCCLLFCCAHLKATTPKQDCVDEIANSAEAAPGENVIVTLDGQLVDLEAFFEMCDQNNPRCSLYKKFHFWQNKIITTDSPSQAGLIRHQIRAYFSPSSICYPERVHPGRIYGDVAEFYDANGEFMGIAVYMGDGNYYPLPFSGYTKKQGISIFPSITM
jgi:hypothetical protein